MPGCRGRLSTVCGRVCSSRALRGQEERVVARGDVAASRHLPSQRGGSLRMGRTEEVGAGETAPGRCQGVREHLPFVSKWQNKR